MVLATIIVIGYFRYILGTDSLNMIKGVGGGIGTRKSLCRTVKCMGILIIHREVRQVAYATLFIGKLLSMLRYRHSLETGRIGSRLVTIHRRHLPCIIFFIRHPNDFPTLAATTVVFIWAFAFQMLDTACQAVVPIPEEEVQCRVIECLGSWVIINRQCAIECQRGFQVLFRRPVHEIIVVVVAGIPQTSGGIESGGILKRGTDMRQIVAILLDDILSVVLRQNASGQGKEDEATYCQTS